MPSCRDTQDKEQEYHKVVHVGAYEGTRRGSADIDETSHERMVAGSPAFPLLASASDQCTGRWLTLRAL